VPERRNYFRISRLVSIVALELLVWAVGTAMQHWKWVSLMLLVGGSSATGAPRVVVPSSLTRSSPVDNPGRQLLQQTQPQAPSGQPAILAPSEESAATANPNEPKFLIHKIQVSGVTRLSSRELHTIVRPYEDRPLGVSDINLLMGA
jgi:hemolysin activation/secretion protein